ncbi:glycoside hydrolase family 2 TIM barrel-domain containing protein [Ulvibacterium sp.]|uniref:glycoside hydrolase family 2 protein n=1 Tax=Ulvibacterium sp. TaxID=2665914 RepID=UPI002622A5D8|nr:glycoside hydrolase family 2 TIM barrel-domain containing protein [Ulvibacterium sp.]
MNSISFKRQGTIVLFNTPSFRVFRYIAISWVMSLGISFSVSGQEDYAYKRIYLSGKDASKTVDWDFKVTDGAKSGVWSKLPVPSNWELHGFGTYNYGHDHRNENRKLGKEHGLYRHSFQVPAQWKGKIINIVFDGSMTDTKVTINNKSAGEMHQGSFYRFKYDISKLLKYGQENVLEVDVAKHSANESVNSAERQADFWIFGGIFRPVFLEVLPDRHFTRTAIDAKHTGEFNALVTINRPISKGSARVTLFSSEGNRVGEILSKPFARRKSELKLSGSFNTITSWNPESPHLYNALFELLENGKTVYQKRERFGFRSVELRENDGIYVNEKRVVFKGVNRHSFWPETGRALSGENHLEDIRLMKEMNMNAVRMSHYGPDERFLELCDSLGLFVLDELTGWQDAYDTVVGPKLIKELLLKDENHPSVVVWDHGNEGGWDFANEKWFHSYDIQKRPVIYPWLKRNGMDTRHYPTYDYGINRLARGNEPFMPTEFLHGLYDGGHGAGLDDFWKNYSAHPMFSGGFLWVFSDEAVVRRDRGNTLDSDGNHAPDGIVGPYREKEGSFYTIKEIWSPVQIGSRTITSNFDGKLALTNTYLYTNLDQCTFSWEIRSVPDFDKTLVLASGKTKGPNVAPGETRYLQLEIPKTIKQGAIFSMTATDNKGMEIYTWNWHIKQPDQVAGEFLQQVEPNLEKREIEVVEKGNDLKVNLNELGFVFDKENGHLEKVSFQEKPISFGGGPLPVGIESHIKDVQWGMDKDGSFILETRYNTYPEKVQWKLLPTGLLKLEVSPLHFSGDGLDFIGISFNYPEKKVKGVKWMGQGPYRVWKNRAKGAEIGVWEKEYNNTITGASFDNLVYPEFKGYHGNLFWAELRTEELPIRIITETPGLFLRLYTPADAEHIAGGVAPPFPEGDISFLYEIPPIGTKFKQADKLGPSSQKGTIAYHKGDQSDPIILWFDFGSKLP